MGKSPIVAVAWLVFAGIDTSPGMLDYWLRHLPRRTAVAVPVPVAQRAALPALRHLVPPAVLSLSTLRNLYLTHRSPSPISSRLGCHLVRKPLSSLPPSLLISSTLPSGTSPAAVTFSPTTSRSLARLRHLSLPAAPRVSHLAHSDRALQILFARPPPVVLHPPRTTMLSPPTNPIPITILTGFLGSGKTTLLLSLLPQLPVGYKLCLLKNEFGDVAVDSRLAQQSSVAGVTELLNGW